MLSSLRHFLSPTEENSIVVCAKRNLDRPANVEDETNVLRPAREFIDSGRIKLMDIGEEESTFSSTAVRNAVKLFGVGEEGRKVWERWVVSSVARYIESEGLYVE